MEKAEHIEQEGTPTRGFLLPMSPIRGTSCSLKPIRRFMAIFFVTLFGWFSAGGAGGAGAMIEGATCWFIDYRMLTDPQRIQQWSDDSVHLRRKTKRVHSPAKPRGRGKRNKGTTNGVPYRNETQGKARVWAGGKKSESNCS